MLHDLEAVFFYLFAFVAVAAAFMVIAARNPVHSVLYLILTFFNAAALFLLTGAEFLRFTAALFGQDGNAVEERIEELLDLFELIRWKDELTESYSHGMRQKLIISSAFVHRPEVIVVDEPMIGLDPKSARILRVLFRRFVDKGGTILMSTHTLEIVEGFCDRIGIIRQGELAACGTLEELRSEAAAEGARLEDLFLRLTGEHIEPDLDAIIG